MSRTLSKKFLVIDTAVSLLGYPLSLSPLEKDLLYVIASIGAIGLDEFYLFSNGRIKREQVVSLVFRINTKAQRISGRPLIVYAEERYHINEVM